VDANIPDLLEQNKNVSFPLALHEPISDIPAYLKAGLGWVANLAHSSENLTGISFGGVETFAKELELLKEISPHVRQARRFHPSLPALSCRPATFRTGLAARN